MGGTALRVERALAKGLQKVVQSLPALGHVGTEHLSPLEDTAMRRHLEGEPETTQDLEPINALILNRLNFQNCSNNSIFINFLVS